jgi:hypothetical protein
MLFVVEEGIEFVLCETPPPGLIFQVNAAICHALRLVIQPDWNSFNLFIVAKLPFQTILVFFADP